MIWCKFFWWYFDGKYSKSKKVILNIIWYDVNFFGVRFIRESIFIIKYNVLCLVE